MRTLSKAIVSVTLLVFSLNLPAIELPKGEWTLFDADVLGNFYASDGSQLIKLKPDGTLVASYQDAMLGQIRQVDCYNGLEILVFHHETNTIVLLDRYLSPLGRPVEFSTYGFYDVEAACLSNDKGYWIADPHSGKLLLLDKNLSVKMQGDVYRQYTKAGQINYFVQRGQSIYLTTNENIYLQFDQFGSFVQRTTIPDMQSPFVSGKSFYYSTGTEVVVYNTDIRIFDTITGSLDKKIRGILKSKNRLYLCEENKIVKLNP